MPNATELAAKETIEKASPSTETAAKSGDARPVTAQASKGTPRVLFVKVDEVRLYQPPQHPGAQVLIHDGQAFPSDVKANAPLGLQAMFSLEPSSTHAPSEASGVPSAPVLWEVAFRARRLSSSEVTTLGSVVGHVTDDGASGTARITTHGLPPGEYSLQIMVTAHDGCVGAGYGEVPFLQLI